MNPARFSSFAAFALLMAFPVLAAEKVPDVKDALKDWVAAVESGSADNIVDLYDNHAVMISTFMQHPMTKRAELMGYYKKVVANPDVKVEVTEQHARTFGNMAINTGEYTFSYTQDGESVIIPARFSFTYVLRGGKWVIVDHHSSRVPLAEK